MNKLVRDAIPDKMHTENQAPIYRVLAGSELQKALLEKLKEEADEALAAINNDSDFLGEIADIREVVDTLAKNRNISPTKLAKARAEKRTKRGGFSQGYFVETVSLDDNSEWVDYYRDQPGRYIEILPDDSNAEFGDIPIIEPGVYRHYKGGYYDVLGVAYGTETNDYFVVYKTLYKKPTHPEIWARPFDMFCETIEKEGKIIPRFSKYE